MVRLRCYECTNRKACDFFILHVECGLFDVESMYEEAKKSPDFDSRKICPDYQHDHRIKTS